MKMNTTYAAIALSLGLAAASNAALSYTSLNLIGTSAGSTIFGNGDGGGWDFEEGGSWANAYYDADHDQVYGETLLGENSGDTNATLALTVDIADGLVMNFGLQGWTIGGGTLSSRFTITNTDDSTQLVTVNDGESTNFTDSNGDQWSVAYAFSNQANAADVVGSLTHNPGNGGNDHEAALTFTAVPEPSSAALLGLGGLALILRRRK